MLELYLELRQCFSRNMYDFPHDEDARTRMRYIWDKFMGFGAENPEDICLFKRSCGPPASSTKRTKLPNVSGC